MVKILFLLLGMLFSVECFANVELVVRLTSHSCSDDEAQAAGLAPLECSEHCFSQPSDGWSVIRCFATVSAIDRDSDSYLRDLLYGLGRESLGQIMTAIQSGDSLASIATALAPLAPRACEGAKDKATYNQYVHQIAPILGCK